MAAEEQQREGVVSVGDDRDVLFRKAIPDVYAATLRDIKGFADSL